MDRKKILQVPNISKKNIPDSTGDTKRNKLIPHSLPKEQRIRILEEEIKYLRDENSNLYSELDLANQKITQLNKTIKEIRLNEATKARNRKIPGISSDISSSKKYNALDITVIPKTPAEREFLLETLKGNNYLKHLESSQIKRIVDCMSFKIFNNDEILFNEGDDATNMLIVESGKLLLTHTNDLVADLRPGSSFGEASILYSCPRMASCVAIENNCKIWFLERHEFQIVMLKSVLKRQKEYSELLKGTVVLSKIPETSLLRVIDIVQELSFEPMEVIFNIGQIGSTFYVVKEGTVEVTRNKILPGLKPFSSKNLGRGYYFGERTLFGEDRYVVDAVSGPKGCTLLAIESEDFLNLLESEGPVDDTVTISKYDSIINKNKTLEKSKKPELILNSRVNSYNNLQHDNYPLNRDKERKHDNSSHNKILIKPNFDNFQKPSLVPNSNSMSNIDKKVNNDTIINTSNIEIKYKEAFNKNNSQSNDNNSDLHNSNKSLVSPHSGLTSSANWKLHSTNNSLSKLHEFHDHNYMARNHSNMQNVGSNSSILSLEHLNNKNSPNSNTDLDNNKNITSFYPTSICNINSCNNSEEGFTHISEDGSVEFKNLKKGDNPNIKSVGYSGHSSSTIDNISPAKSLNSDYIPKLDENVTSNKVIAKNENKVDSTKHENNLSISSSLNLNDRNTYSNMDNQSSYRKSLSMDSLESGAIDPFLDHSVSAITDKSTYFETSNVSLENSNFNINSVSNDSRNKKNEIIFNNSNSENNFERLNSIHLPSNINFPMVKPALSTHEIRNQTNNSMMGVKTQIVVPNRSAENPYIDSNNDSKITWDNSSSSVDHSKTNIADGKIIDSVNIQNQTNPSPKTKRTSIHESIDLINDPNFDIKSNKYEASKSSSIPKSTSLNGSESGLNIGSITNNSELNSLLLDTYSNKSKEVRNVSFLTTESKNPQLPNHVKCPPPVITNNSYISDAKNRYEPNKNLKKQINDASRLASSIVIPNKKPASSSSFNPKQAQMMLNRSNMERNNAENKRMKDFNSSSPYNSSTNQLNSSSDFKFSPPNLSINNQHTIDSANSIPELTSNHRNNQQNSNINYLPKPEIRTFHVTNIQLDARNSDSNLNSNPLLQTTTGDQYTSKLNSPNYNTISASSGMSPGLPNQGATNFQKFNSTEDFINKSMTKNSEFYKNLNHSSKLDASNTNNINNSSRYPGLSEFNPQSYSTLNPVSGNNKHVRQSSMSNSNQSGLTANHHDNLNVTSINFQKSPQKSSSTNTSINNNITNNNPNTIANNLPINKNLPSNLIENARLDHLRIVGTLGVGTMSHVYLVSFKNMPKYTFALKQMKKNNITKANRQERVLGEKNILLACGESKFIVQLYKTFKDRKYLYMLLEACLGGELYTLIREHVFFDDKAARFYSACVIEALQYLHKKTIIYRDLKPENMLIDTVGYCKLADFGCAKRLGLSKRTWTFCGTPEYVAPEIILSKGYDYSVDYWALGIFICELLSGHPPLFGSDSMKTYNIILRGFDSEKLQRPISRDGMSLVKKLCKLNPAERIGYNKASFLEIKKHKWFENFSWTSFLNRSMPPPIRPKIKNENDTSNFDFYPKDNEIPPDDLSGWDKEF